MHITSFKRRIASIVLVTFTSLTLQPMQAVAQAKLAQTGAAQGSVQSASVDEQYATLLDQIKETVKRNAARAKAGTGTPADAQTLRSQIAQLQVLDTQVDQAFAATEADLKAKNLPAEILARHQTAVADFNAKRADFKRQLNILDTASAAGTNSTAQINGLNTLSNWLDQNQPAKTQTKTDPNNLPFRTPEAKVRVPVDSEEGYKAKLGLFGFKPVRLAGAIPSGGIRFTQALDPNAPPTAADLAETIDVQLTPAIRAKAAEFGNHPVDIHNWVRNNIEFIPTYGSIQGSDMTLQTKRGNAFDTASLEIALMRAAGIPARYVYGTIEVPVEKVMNWAGGLTKPEAALTLLAQGGIPSIGLYAGGKISAVRMEHVWVEAYVDYVPSRGAINRKPNTWVPLDGSFKQYTYTQGMDIKSNVPMEALLTQAQAGATVNEAEGWVQNINQVNLQAALTQYQTQVKAYVDSQKPGATVGDVIGTKTINQQNHVTLLGTLPYKRIATAAKLSSLPDMLRHQFRYGLYASDYDRAMDNAVFTYTGFLPNLAGKKVTLSFAPSSKADADTIASYLPKPHADGSPIQASELPRSLPAYLIHVTAQLKVEGQVVASGGTYALGQELLGEGGFTRYDLSGWDLSTDGTIVSGQTSALGLSLQGISADQIAKLKARMESAKTKLEANDTNGLSGGDIVSDLLTATVWGYLSTVESFGKLARQANMVDLPGLSYGFFHASVVPSRLYGIVTTSVRFPGVMMDIGHLRHDRVAKDGDVQAWVKYNRMRGMQASMLEGVVPETLLAEPNATVKVESVSAAKAIAVAAAQGQKIFTITQANAAVAFPQLRHTASVMEEIQNAVAAGKEVTISQARVTVGGWTGAGYVIVDQKTGAGAYMIEGGSNGGFAIGGLLGSLGALGVLMMGFAFALPAGLLGFTLILLGALLLGLVTLAVMELDDPCVSNGFITMLAIGLGIVSFGAAILAGLVAAILTIVASDVSTTPRSQCP